MATRGDNLGGGDQPIRVTCGRVTPNLFSTLGVEAARGRWIAEDDDTSGRRVVVLTDQLWRSYFGGDGSVEALCTLAGAATLEDAFMTLKSLEA